MIQSIAPNLDPRGTASTRSAATGEALSNVACATAGFDVCGFEAHRGHLTQYATWLLGSRQAAQAAVQAAFGAAASAPQVPANPASLRPWLFSLVKRKVIDTLRRPAHLAPVHDDSAEEGGDGAPAFLPDGHWCNEPTAWGDPDQALADAGFLSLLERCIDRLPKNTARVYTMREILGLDTQEICATVGITTESCSAMLCRARLAVRDRLERDWFAARKMQ